MNRRIWSTTLQFVDATRLGRLRAPSCPAPTIEGRLGNYDRAIPVGAGADHLRDDRSEDRMTATIDLTRLPAPAIIEALDYETLQGNSSPASPRSMGG